MQKCNICFIDTGIRLIHQSSNNEIVRLALDSQGNVIPRKEKTYDLNHATACAYILLDLVDNTTIYDIPILSNQGVGNIKTFLHALTWCYNNNISIIHLSLGTVVFHEYLAMKHLIRKLLQKNVIIVAAFHNQDIITYPAVIDGVIGVYADKRNSLDINEIAYNAFERNCFLINTVEHIKQSPICVKNAMHNSFAVPIVVSHIIHYIQKGAPKTLQQVMNFLYRKAQEHPVFDQKIKNIPMGPSQKTAKIIYWEGYDEKSIMNIWHQLYILGIRTELVSDELIDERVMPIYSIWGQEKIDNQSIYFLNTFYQSDLWVIFFDTQAPKYKIEPTEYDLLICSEINGFVVKEKKTCVHYSYPIEVVHRVYSLFTYQHR